MIIDSGANWAYGRGTFGSDIESVAISRFYMRFLIHCQGLDPAVRAGF